MVNLRLEGWFYQYGKFILLYNGEFFYILVIQELVFMIEDLLEEQFEVLVKLGMLVEGVYF